MGSVVEKIGGDETGTRIDVPMDENTEMVGFA
jgi:hypothetical protein